MTCRVTVVKTSRVRQSFRRALRRIVGLVAVAVVLVGIARSGGRYFECSMMGAMLADACCTAHHDDDDRPTLDAPVCCSSHRVGDLPTGSAVTSPPLDDAPVGEVLSTYLAVVGTRRPDPVIAHGYDARAGPGSPSRRRADMMIWNC